MMQEILCYTRCNVRMFRSPDRSRQLSYSQYVGYDNVEGKEKKQAGNDKPEIVVEDTVYVA